MEILYILMIMAQQHKERPNPPPVPIECVEHCDKKVDTNTKKE